MVYRKPTRATYMLMALRIHSIILGLPICSASLAGQAAECVQQAMEWATTLVQRLARVDAEAILQAVVSSWLRDCASAAVCWA